MRNVFVFFEVKSLGRSAKGSFQVQKHKDQDIKKAVQSFVIHIQDINQRIRRKKLLLVRKTLNAFC